MKVILIFRVLLKKKSLEIFTQYYMIAIYFCKQYKIVQTEHDKVVLN